MENNFIDVDAFILKQVGEYIINNDLHISFTRKPNRIHRFFSKLLLGWEWVDFK